MCKLYIETSDLDKAVEAAKQIMLEAGGAVIGLKSEVLNQYVEQRLAGIDFVSPRQHTKFSIVVGIVIGLELARTGLSLEVKTSLEDYVTAYDVA